MVLPLLKPLPRLPFDLRLLLRQDLVRNPVGRQVQGNPDVV